ncbi:BTB/POZ domain-containing protein 6-like [Cloeon dipterum]|uniref:BTB/POZ domain-containing protein 6-like n=1 Tax=Cloeon dipterum TaxID=197152 RepID=UPI00321FBE80
MERIDEEEREEDNNQQQSPGSKACICDNCKRSEEILLDRLTLYTESEYYDCTFRVGNENPKIFKCHKLILARASEVFAKMLYGDFKEGQKSKDDAIVIETNISPNAFDSAMRFIYGNEKVFPTTSLACEVYKFADKWQIENLRHAASLEIGEAELDQILLVYEMYKSLGDKHQEDNYLKVIVGNTSEILESPYWIDVAPSTVLEIFSQPKLNVDSERVLFDALVKWGEANSESPVDLRTNIDSALKQILFMTMESEEFAELCATSEDIFSVEERYQIFMSIGLRDFEQLPPDFSTGYQTRHQPHIYFLLDFNPRYCVCDATVNCDSPMSSFTFAVRAEVSIFLSNFELNCLVRKENFGLEADIVCCLSTHDFKKILGVATVKGTIGPETKTVEFRRPVYLSNNTWYTISISYLKRNDLQTKIFEYKNLPHRSWSWQPAKNSSIRVYHYESRFIHTDINKIIFSYLTDQ